MYSIHPLPPPLPPPPPLYHHHFPALKPLLAELEVVEILIADLSRTFQTLITETPLLPPIRLEVRLAHQMGVRLVTCMPANMNV